MVVRAAAGKFLYPMCFMFASDGLKANKYK